MPAPASLTTTTTSSAVAVTSTRTGGRPCFRALPTRLATMASSRRGSATVMAPSVPAVAICTWSPQPRVPTAEPTRATMSTGSQAIGRGPGVEPGDLHEVLDQGGEPVGLADQEPGGAAPGVVQPGLVGLEHVGRRRQRRERRAQLVADVGHEAPVAGLEVAEVADRLLQRFGHAVEGVAQVGELVAALLGKAGAEQADLEAVGRRARLAEGPQQAAGGDGAHPGREHDGGDARARRGSCAAVPGRRRRRRAGRTGRTRAPRPAVPRRPRTGPQPPRRAPARPVRHRPGRPARRAPPQPRGRSTWSRTCRRRPRPRRRTRPRPATSAAAPGRPPGSGRARAAGRRRRRPAGPGPRPRPPTRPAAAPPRG